MAKASSPQANSIINDDRWQRLAPIAIVYFIAKGIVSIANFLIYLLPVLFLNLSDIRENLSIALLVLGVLSGLVVISALVSYYCYSFLVGEQRIEIKQGWLKKSHVDLPFDRIQNVRLEQPIYYRFNDFSCVELDTAGSAGQEAKLVAVPTPTAHFLKQHIMQYKALMHEASMAQGDISQTGVNAASEDLEQVLNTRSIKDLVIHGIANNRIWIILGGLAPFYKVISENVEAVFASVGIELGTYFSLQSQAWWEFSLHVLSLALLIMLVIVAFSIMGSILVFYGYRLSKTAGRYIRRSGLLTKQEVSMKLSRLQLVVCEQDWLDNLLGRVNLRFQQNTSGAINSQQQGMRSVDKLIVPSVTAQQAQALIDDAMPQNQLKRLPFVSISKRFILRLVVIVLLPLVVALIALGALQSPRFYVVAAVISVLLLLLIVLRWYRWGYAYDNTYVYVRKGLFGVDYCCFERYKLQQASFVQSLFLRPHKLAGVNLVLACGKISIPYMQEQDALDLIDESLELLESSRLSWM